METLTPAEQAILEIIYASEYVRLTRSNIESKMYDRPVQWPVYAECTKMYKRGLLYLVRGGQDDEGNLIGGTAYGLTKEGFLMLCELNKEVK